MEMNDILNGLNPCDDNCCDSGPDNDCCGGQIPVNSYGFPGAAGLGYGGLGNGGLGNGIGCGFGSWIWILLILFYCGCGCGGNGLLGGRGYSNNCGCCDRCECECGCNNFRYNNNSIGGGLFCGNSCTSYLFLLVILFLCNGRFNNVGGFGGNCGGCGIGSNPIIGGNYGFGGYNNFAGNLNNCGC